MLSCFSWALQGNPLQFLSKDAKLEPGFVSLEEAVPDVSEQGNTRSTWDELSGLGSLEHLAHSVSIVTKIAAHYLKPFVVGLLLL